MLNTIRISIITLFISFQFSCASLAAIPAFPGAAGGGAACQGGRGGRVIEVTNLQDSGAGSLRAALEASGPRTVVFKVSGIINLTKRIIIDNPYLTIAGQTAPKGGITIRGNELKVRTHDILIRFISIRPGLTKGGYQDGDCICGESNNVNILYDHISVSWSNDENIQVWPGAGPSHHMTFSWMLNAEGLTYNHPSCGMIISTSHKNHPELLTDISIHHNLFIHFNNRMPWLCTKDAEIINNLMYNGSWFFTQANGGITCDIIGNKYKWGSAGKPMEIHNTHYEPGKDWGVPGQCSLYLHGNVGPHQPNPAGNQWVMVSGASRSCERTKPMSRGSFPVPIQPVTEAEELVLKDVGACRRLDENGNWFFDRDPVDTRLINEYKTGKGIIPKTPESVGGYPSIPSLKGYTDSDHDGMPDVWEKARGLNPNDGSDGVKDRNGDGYTNLEEFLNGISATAPVNQPERPSETDPGSGSASGTPSIITPINGGILPAPSGSASEGTRSGTGKTRIMALGDSITLGTGRGLPKRGGWRIDFWKLCRKAGYDIDFVGSRSDGPDDLEDKENEGHAGYKIHELEEIIPGLLKKNPPDLVMLMIGTHDMVVRYAVDTAPARLEKLINTIYATLPDVQVVVSSVIPINSVPGSAAAAKFNARIPGIVRSFANQGKPVVFADTFTSITTADLDVGGMSPTATGYAKIAKFLFAEVAPYLKERASAAPTTTDISLPATTGIPSGAGDSGDKTTPADSGSGAGDSGDKTTPAGSGSSASGSAGTTRVMPLGDSCTWGQGIGSPHGGGYRIQFLELARKAGLAMDFVGTQKNGPPSMTDRDNQGHPGYEISMIDSLIASKLKTCQPDLILLMIGGNDVIHGKGAAAPEALAKLISTITSTLPTARLIVSSILPIHTTSGMAGAIAFNKKIPAIVEAAAAQGKRVTFVDLFAGMTVKDLDSGGAHPTPSGYVKLGTLWFNAAKPFLGKKAAPITELPVTAPPPVGGDDDQTTSTPGSTADNPTPGMTSAGTPHGSRTLLVAAANAPGSVKSSAKYVCTGKSDQTIINNAFNALGSSGGKIILSEGTFKCSDRIIPGANCWLEGQGSDKTIIEVVNSSNGYIPVTVKKPSVTLKGFKLAGQGFIMISTSRVSVQNVVVTGMLGGQRYRASGNGMFFIWAEGMVCEDIEFVNCSAIDSNTHGYNINGNKTPKLTKNIRFLGCRAIRCGFGVEGGSRSEWITGFDFHEGQNFDGLLVQDCIAEDNWQCGFHLEPDDWNGTYMRNIVFKNCASRNNGKRHPKGEESYYASGFHGFKNCTMTNCKAENNANCGFFGIYTSNAVLKDCHDVGSNHGFKFAKNNDGIKLINCSTKNNKTFGLWISFTKNMTVTGFHQYNVRGARGVQSILGWYKDEAKYQKPVTNSSFEITAHGGSGDIINKAGAGNTYKLNKQ